MAKRGKRGRLYRRALAETDLRYGAERRGLRSLLREAKAELNASIRAEEGAAAGITAAAKAAMPEIRSTYANAGLAFDQADQDVKAAIGSDPNSAAAREAAGARRRLAEAMAEARAELSHRRVDAEAGRVRGVAQARSKYASDAVKIKQQQADLASESGLYAATSYEDLSEAQRKYKLEQRRLRNDVARLRDQQRRTDADLTGRDPVTGRLTADERARRRDDRLAEQREQRQREEANKSNKPKGPTRTQRVNAREDWREAKVLTEQGGPKRGEAESWVSFLVDKGIPEPIARGVTQRQLFGKVKPALRRRLAGDYGLHPRPLTVPGGIRQGSRGGQRYPSFR